MLNVESSRFITEHPIIGPTCCSSQVFPWLDFSLPVLMVYCHLLAIPINVGHLWDPYPSTCKSLLVTQHSSHLPLSEHHSHSPVPLSLFSPPELGFKIWPLTSAHPPPFLLFQSWPMTFLFLGPDCLSPLRLRTTIYYVFIWFSPSCLCREPLQRKCKLDSKKGLTLPLQSPAEFFQLPVWRSQKSRSENPLGKCKDPVIKTETQGQLLF